MSNFVQFIRAVVAVAAVSTAACVLGACAQGGLAPDAAAARPAQAAADALAAYPAQPESAPATKNAGGGPVHYRRYVIDLPSLRGAEDHAEDARRVELIAGRVMTVDCNRQRLGGQFAQREVDGWGYPYWVFESAGPGVATRMACPPGSERSAFVSAPSTFVGYNSRLPLVVYLPEDFVLRWRVWQAGAEQSAQAR